MAKRGIAKVTGEIPGPRSRELYKVMEQEVPRGIFHFTPIAISYAKGATITDVDGNTYIDFAAGVGVLNVGHCPDKVVQAIKEQASKYLHACFHVFIYEPYVQLASKLNQITPGKSAKKTMLVNSGAEAVENAVRISKLYTKRYGILSFMTGFHGRTTLTSSLTGQVQPYKYNYGPAMTGIYHLPFAYCYRCPFGQVYPNCELTCARQMERIFESTVQRDYIASLVVEPVQGEGGFIVPPKEFLAEIWRTCKANGILFIADEIQTGFARTGKMFAVEHFGIEPDIIVTAKSLGGGMVLGAVTGRAEIMEAPHVGGLGGTYGGNPLSCQASLASINIIEEDNLAGKAISIGKRLKERLYAMQEKYSIIGDVRGLGAMVAIELVKDRKTKEPAVEESTLVRIKCYQNGLIVPGAGVHRNVLRFLVPLVITDEELDEGLDILEEAIESVTSIIK